MSVHYYQSQSLKKLLQQSIKTFIATYLKLKTLKITGGAFLLVSSDVNEDIHAHTHCKVLLEGNHIDIRRMLGSKIAY